MEIKGKIHCLFEQSGTFKNEFKKLPALVSRHGSVQGKKQICDNAIAYADMLLKRINEIPADAQQRSEAGQTKNNIQQ